MRRCDAVVAIVIVATGMPILHAQGAPPPDRARTDSVEVIGCVDGRVLTETSLNHSSQGRESTNPAGEMAPLGLEGDDAADS